MKKRDPGWWLVAGTKKDACLVPLRVEYTCTQDEESTLKTLAGLFRGRADGDA